MPKVAQKPVKSAAVTKKVTPPTASGRTSKRKPVHTVKVVKDVPTKTLVVKKKRRMPASNRLRQKTLAEIRWAGQHPESRSIRALPFRKLVKEIIAEVSTIPDMRIAATAVTALQMAAEEHAIRIFQDTDMIADWCGRQTICAHDMAIARTIRDAPEDEGGKRVLTWVKKHEIEWRAIKEAQKKAKAASGAGAAAVEDDDEQEDAQDSTEDGSDSEYESSTSDDGDDDEDDIEESGADGGINL